MQINHKKGDQNGWICLCGNTAKQDDFYPCDGEGELVKPTPEYWTSGCYVCERCGRIIRYSDREVVGLSVHNNLTEAEKADLYSELT